MAHVGQEPALGPVGGAGLLLGLLAPLQLVDESGPGAAPQMPGVGGTEYGAPPKRIGLSHPTVAPYGVFATRDAVPILISIQNDREWAVLCTKILDRPDLVDDARFLDNMARARHRAETDGLVAACFATRDVATLARQLEEAQVAFARVNDVLAVLQHPHFRQVMVESPGGPIGLPTPPAKVMHAPAPSFGPLPALGEHTQAVRREFLEQDRF